MDIEHVARVVAARAEKQRMERQRRAVETRQQVTSLVRSLLPDNARAWLIGSLAWGGYNERSDIDLVVDGLSSEASLQLEIAITRAVDAEVDLMELTSLSAAFRERVLAEGIALHG